MPSTKNRRNVEAGRTRLTGKGALDMVRGKGSGRTTFYNCGIIERARENGVAIRILQGGKETLAQPRMVHRPDLTGTFGATHERAGQGKYIEGDAISMRGDRKIVTGAQNVNPYLVDECYRTIVEAFHRSAGRSALGELTAVVETSQADGEHLEWQGKRSVDDALVVSPWLTREQLWSLAQKVNDELVAVLRSSKSQRRGVKEHLNTKAKFFQNLDVLRRSRRTFHVATGEIEQGGGATPYSMPLEQCGFAIDMYFLTTGFDEAGNEVGEYFYRMAYGRSTPWSLYKREWAGLDVSSQIAYLNETIRQRAMKKSA